MNVPIHVILSQYFAFCIHSLNLGECPPTIYFQIVNDESWSCFGFLLNWYPQSVHYGFALLATRLWSVGFRKGSLTKNESHNKYA